MSCPFANIFGAPRTGVHSIRFFDIALVDLSVTVLLAYLTRKFFCNFWYSLLVWVLSGIILHRLFCVNTTIDEIIFGKK
jgi:hypothetical protein